MRHRAISCRLRRATTIAAAVASLLTACLLSGGAASALPVRPPTIDTHADHGRGVCCFGRPDTSTYGEVLTVPPGMTRLTRFNFYLRAPAMSGSLVLRGEVYAWDGHKAVGPALWEGDPRTVTYDDHTYHRKQFKPHGVIDLEPGQQIVIFASISKDYEQCTEGYQVDWQTAPDGSYPDGTFVFLNDAGDESQWTTEDWTTTWGIDLLFKAWLS